jgi:hypothetical protein
MHDFPPVVPDFEDTAAALPPTPGRTAVAVRPTAPAAGAARGVAAGAARGVAEGAARGDFSHPDTRSPVRFLGWLLRQQRDTVVVLTLVTVVQWLPGAVGPYVVGRIIDDGIRARDLGVVGWLCLLLLGLVLAGAVAGVLSHTLIVRAWLVGMYGSISPVRWWPTWSSPGSCCRPRGSSAWSCWWPHR